ncbi:MAG TPA: hypothetical protein VH650_06495 [Gaiellaceae bacterium]
MDLHLYLRVLKRFRVVVIVGIALAAVLALSSYYTIGRNGLTHREGQTWESAATISVDPKNYFLYGRSISPETAQALDQARAGSPEALTEIYKNLDPAEFADAGNLTSTAIIYLKLATSDAVINRIREDGKGPLGGTLQTFPVLAGGETPVPMIIFDAVAPTPEAAVSLAQRHVAAFKDFVTHEQNASGIPQDERVVVNTVNAPQSATLLEDRKKTRPILIFLTGLIAVLGLAFVLENLRPRGPGGTVMKVEEDEQPVEKRRTA